jgi:Macoilin family
MYDHRHSLNKHSICICVSAVHFLFVTTTFLIFQPTLLKSLIIDVLAVSSVSSLFFCFTIYKQAVNWTFVSCSVEQHKQKAVQKANAFYTDLLRQSLPAEQVETAATTSLRTDDSSGTTVNDQRKTKYQPDSDCFVTAGTQNISYCYNSDVTGAFDEAETSFETHPSITDVNDFRDCEQQQNNSKVVYKATVAAATKNCLSSSATKSDNITTASTLKQIYANNRDDVINRYTVCCKIMLWVCITSQ